MEELQAQDIAQQNHRAKATSSVLEWNREVRPPQQLFDSRCPRLCVPLKNTHKLTWGDELNTTDPVMVNAGIMMALARHKDVETTSQSFGPAYKWFFGSECEDGAEVQREVCSALDISMSSVLSGNRTLYRSLVFADTAAKCMWIFFTDGRVDFGKILKACTMDPMHGGVKLCKPLDSTNGMFPASFEGLMHSLNRQVESGDYLNTILPSILPTHEEVLPSSVPKDIDPVVRELYRFVPRLPEDFHGADLFSEFGRRTVTQVLCAPRVRMEIVLSWPNVFRRTEFLLKEIKWLEQQKVRTPLADKVLEVAQSNPYIMNDQRLLLGSELCDLADGGSKFDIYSGVVDDSASSAGGEEEQQQQQQQQQQQNAAEPHESWKDPLVDYNSGLVDNAMLATAGGGMAGTAADQDLFAESRQISAELDQVEQTDKQFEREMSSIGSASTVGEAKLQFFKETSVFQRYREINGKLRESIAKRYPVGSQMYREEMVKFRRTAVEQAVHGFMTSQDVSEPIKVSRIKMKRDGIKVMESPLICRHVPVFGNFIMSLMSDLNEAFSPGPGMEDSMLCVLTATAGFWHTDKLRPNILLAGEASVGKSYTLNLTAKMMPDGVSFVCSYETDKANLVEGSRTDVLQTMEELPQVMLGVDAYNKVREVSSHQKDALTSNYQVTNTIAVYRDEETGKTRREQVRFRMRQEIARQAATNCQLPPEGNAQLERWIVRNVSAVRDPNNRIINFMYQPSWAKIGEDSKEVMSKWKTFFTVQLFIEKLIESRAIEDVNMDCMSEMKELLNYVEEHHRINTDNPKMLDKIFAVCRLCTISYAVYAGLTCESREARAVRECPDTGRELPLKDILVNAALAIEPFLVCTREIIVYVFSLLRTEWMPVLRQKILETIRDYYITGRLCGGDAQQQQGGKKTAAAAADERRDMSKVPLQFTSPPYSRLSQFNEADVEGGVENKHDSSYIVLADEVGSNRFGAIATFLSRKIRTRLVSTDAICRELEAMARIRFDAPIFYHDRSLTAAERAAKAPSKLMTKAGVGRQGVVITQEMPMIFNGRLPREHELSSHGGINSTSNGAYRNTFAPSSAAAAAAAGDYGKSYSNDARMHTQNPVKAVGGLNEPQQQQQQHGRQQDNKGIQPRGFTKDYVCLISYGAVQNPNDRLSIIRSAVQHLGHYRQMPFNSKRPKVDKSTGMVIMRTNEYGCKMPQMDMSQRFIISQPPEVQVEDPTVRGKMQSITMFKLPSVIEVPRRRASRALINSKPVLEYEMGIRNLRHKRREVRESRSSGVAASNSRARQVAQSILMQHCDSSHMLLTTDPDNLALATHHVNMGIVPQARHHWTFLMEDLAEEHERDGLDYYEIEEMVQQNAEAWSNKKKAKQLFGVEHGDDKHISGTWKDHEAWLAASTGIATSTVRDQRRLTELERTAPRITTGHQRNDDHEDQIDSFFTNDDEITRRRDKVISKKRKELGSTVEDKLLASALDNVTGRSVATTTAVGGGDDKEKGDGGMLSFFTGKSSNDNLPTLSMSTSSLSSSKRQRLDTSSHSTTTATAQVSRSTLTASGYQSHGTTRSSIRGIMLGLVECVLTSANSEGGGEKDTGSEVKENQDNNNNNTGTQLYDSDAEGSSSSMTFSTDGTQQQQKRLLKDGSGALMFQDVRLQN